MNLIKQNRQKLEQVDPVEARFLKTFNLVKDFAPADFKRWHESAKEMYGAYQKAKKAKTSEEKEDAEISVAEKNLEFMEEKND